MDVSRRGLRALRSRPDQPEPTKKHGVACPYPGTIPSMPERLWPPRDDGRTRTGCWASPREPSDVPERNICSQNP